MAGSLLLVVIGAVLLAVTWKWLRPDAEPKTEDEALNQPLNFVVILVIGAGFFLLGLAGILYVLVTGDDRP